jgi:predicted ester cyclase
MNRANEDQIMKALFGAYVEIWESARVEDLPLVIHHKYIGHPGSGDRDNEGLRQRILAFHKSFSDVQFRIEDQLTDGDKVATRMIAKATRSKDAQKVTLYGLNISRISDRRIIEEWMAWEVESDAS